MKKAGLVFPHQLFEKNPLLDEGVTKIYLIEDPLFFKDRYTQIVFQKKKILLHRATMRWYKDFLEKQGCHVVCIEFDSRKTTTSLIENIAEEVVYCVDPTDFLIEKRLKKTGKQINYLATPYFLNTREENESFLEKHPKFIMHNFYVWQRKRLDILIDEDGKPEGGSWSFDEANRQKLPNALFKEAPNLISYVHDSESRKYITEASIYIKETFSDAHGTVDDFPYPITHRQAKEWFQTFLKERFEYFGPYEDAFTTEHAMLYHAVLTPSLNCGLITPKYVVQEALRYAKEHDVPLNSLEGFIRQIIGWREYMRLVYQSHGVVMRTTNSWNFTNKIPQAFYEGTTGIDPLDHVISKTVSSGYAHHIERLMVLGNIMLLLEINPDEVYRWFMELFIDSYDWVMVPNVYAMSQYADGGMMTTKPYISSSNYIRKMSNYEKGEWCEVWDALYWDFIVRHLEQLKANGRMHFVVSRAEKFSDEQKEQYRTKANIFKKSLGLQ